MSDIFAPLREPEPVSPLAPEEVRRRGDRLRRRRAGLAVVGAAAAAVIIVGATSLAVGELRGSRPSPDPVEPPTEQALIPEEFDLADGLPRELASTGIGAPALVICGERFSLADRATASEGFSSDNRGDLTVRGLSVYRDAAVARSVASDLVAQFEGCPRFTDPRGRRWTTSVRTTANGDQGWVVAQFADASGPGVDFPEVTQIVRVGASLLVTQQREIHGVPLAALTRGSSDQVAWLMHRQMCLLPDEGCAWRSDPDVLRPNGWGRFQLGMSREEVEAMGITRFTDAGACTTVDLGSGEGSLSEADELVSIQVPEDVATPDGIGPGSSREEVLELYPFAEERGDVILVRASPTADYQMTLERDQVTQLRLTTEGEVCSG